MDIALAYSYGAKRIDYLYGRQREEEMHMASWPHIGSMTSRIGDKRVRDVTRIRQMLRYQDAIREKVNSIECSSYEYYIYPEGSSPDNTVIYCDPPYDGKRVEQYCESFDHDRFRQWVRDSPYLIMVSETHMPDDFICVAEFDRLVLICKKDRWREKDRLYVHKDKADVYRRMMDGDD